MRINAKILFDRKFITAKYKTLKDNTVYTVNKDIRGYKGVNSDMTCRGYEYELECTHIHKEMIELCESGFHACFDLRDVGLYYEFHTPFNRFFEVLIPEGAEIIIGMDKFVCNKIELVRELKDFDFIMAGIDYKPIRYNCDWFQW